jgi:hypothetical protein
MGKTHNTLEELALYAMQGLPVEQSASISTHLESCSACRTDHAQVGVDLALMGLVVQQRELPLGARERFMERVADTLAKTTTIPVNSASREPGSARIFEISAERTACDVDSSEVKPERKTAPGTTSAVEKKSLLSMSAPASMATGYTLHARSTIETARPAASRFLAARGVKFL